MGAALLFVLFGAVHGLHNHLAKSRFRSIPDSHRDKIMAKRQSNCTSLLDDYPESCITDVELIDFENFYSPENIATILNDFCTPDCIGPYVDFVNCFRIPRARDLLQQPSLRQEREPVLSGYPLLGQHDLERCQLRSMGRNLRRLLRQQARNRRRWRRVGMLRCKLLCLHWSNVRRRCWRYVRRSGWCGSCQPSRARPDNDLRDGRCCCKRRSLLSV